MKNLLLLFIAGVLTGLILGSALSYLYLHSRSEFYEDESKNLYAVLNGQKIWGKDVLPDIEQDLWDLERSQFRIKKRAVEKVLLDQLNPKKRPVEAFGDESEMQSEIASVDNNEFKAFLDLRQISLKGLKPKQIQDLKANFLIHNKMMEEKKREQALLEAAKIEWYLPIKFNQPPVSLDPGGVFFEGPADAKKRMVVFFNYHCPQCAKTDERIQALLEKSAGSLKVEYRPVALEREEDSSYQAVLASLCASEQPKSWRAFHKHLLLNQARQDTDFVKIAQQLKLDSAQFQKCFQGKAVHERLQKEVQVIQSLGRHKLPLLIANGYRVAPAESNEFLESALNLGTSNR